MVAAPGAAASNHSPTVQSPPVWQTLAVASSTVESPAADAVDGEKANQLVSPMNQKLRPLVGFPPKPAL